jgi:hypothetical protein
VQLTVNPHLPKSPIRMRELARIDLDYAPRRYGSLIVWFCNIAGIELSSSATPMNSALL